MTDNFYHLESQATGLSHKLLRFIKATKRTTTIDGNYLKISDGKQFHELYIPDILPAKVMELNQEYDLKTYAFKGLTESLKLTYENQEYLIESKHYSYNQFINFLKIMQKVWIETHQTFEEKLDVIYDKCVQHIRHDRRLETEFEQKLNEIYNSVYQVYQIDKKEPMYKQILKHPDTVFYYLNRYNYYYYYRRNHYKPNTDTESIDAGESMIQTVLLNLKIARSRIDSYQKIQEDVQRRKIDYRNKKKLAKLAQDLESLQEKNMQHGFKKQELDYDTEVVEQLDLLTDNIGEITTEEKSELLQAHILSFAEMTENNEDLLRDLNQKLKR